MANYLNSLSTCNFINIVCGKARTDGSDNGNTAAHTCFKEKIQVVRLGDGQQFIPFSRHQLFVGGDHALSRQQTGFHKIVGGVQSPHGLHYDADILILQNIVKHGGEQRRIRQFRERAQIQDPLDPQLLSHFAGDMLLVGVQHLGNAGAHHAVSQNSNLDHCIVPSC